MRLLKCGITQRGVVSTCSYEARKFGVRSAMNIKEAYRLCPQGLYMHPNPRKYAEASEQVHRIWLSYTDIMEFISLDEGFLDVTGPSKPFGGARNIGLAIKERTKAETDVRQLTIEDMANLQSEERVKALDKALLDLQRRYDGSVIKTGNEMMAEKRFFTGETEREQHGGVSGSNL